MNPEIKAKWLAALRSGEYKQGRGYLQNGKGEFCCLGVLCDLYRKETGNGVWKVYYKEKTFQLGKSIYPDFPPDAVINWAEFGDQTSSLRGIRVNIDGLTTTLDDHNDSKKTFSQIADAMEDQIPGDGE